MSRTLPLSLLTLTLILAGLPSAAARTGDSEALARLSAEAGIFAKIRTSPATGTATFIRFAPGSIDLELPRDAGPADQAAAFLRKHGGAFGIASPDTELRSLGLQKGAFGTTRAGYVQTYRGLPVFGTKLHVHFDTAGRLVGANGTFVPGIRVSETPSFGAKAAGQIALQSLGKQIDVSDVSVRRAELMIFRSGLVRGIDGDAHLAWRIEAGNGSSVREFVFVDAHDLAVLDQITGIHTAIHRRVDHQFLGTTVWEEGDSQPFDHPDVPENEEGQVDDIIETSLDVYSLFEDTWGFTSWDDADGTMITVWNSPQINCPNANWNGVSTNYCPGLGTDDVVAHEWGHAYTDSTHNLIYQWQSGALNESYSDIWGETVDILNGLGTDAPTSIRDDGGCSTVGGSPVPSFTVNTGGAAGDYGALRTSLEPPLPIDITGNLAIASPPDACSAVSGVSGSIAIIDWAGGGAGCGSADKTARAFAAGAIGVLMVADPSGPIGLLGSSDIATVQVLNDDGELIKANLPATATIQLEESADDSLRWLMGEDSTVGGAIRDMWNPTCFGNPGKVSDKLQFICDGAIDGGGVHINSGIPNHAFALLVDGGTYNGQTVTGIGLAKAAHIYFQAMTTYQTPVTDFIGHAEAITASCDDLVGMVLPGLDTEPDGARGGTVTIMAADCEEVDKALLAVEMWDTPTFCNFEQLLDTPAPIAECGDPLLSEDFESEPTSWTLSNEGVTPADYTIRDWEWTADVPFGGDGMAMFALDSIELGNCTSDDESGVMHLDSPELVVPGGANDPVLFFDHWVATEAGWDGGNVKIAVNDGSFQLIDAADFYFNPYNSALEAAPGNTNPMEGEAAFTGANDGSTGSGNWGQSQIQLGNYVAPGDSFVIRFDLGVDGCNGAIGWYVDNVNVCAAGAFSLFADGFESGDTSAW